VLTALWGAGLGISLGVGVWLMLSVVASRREQTRTVSATPTPTPRRRDPVAVRRTLVTVTIGVFVSVALGLITGIPGLGVVAGITAVAVPWAVTRARTSRRSRFVAEAWPGVIDELISTLRSGGTVTAAMSQLVGSSRGVISAGARDFMIAVSTTSDVSGSLSLAKRVWASAVGDRVAETLRLAGECGGAGVMHGLVALARDVRRESSVQAEVRARAAWIRVAAVVGAVAPWIAVLVLATRPEGRQAYGTIEGTLVLLVGYGVTVFAYLLVSRIAEPAADVRVLA
jgi:tight adherence protein B